MKFYIKLSQRFIGVWRTKQPASLGMDLDKWYRQDPVATVQMIRWH